MSPFCHLQSRLLQLFDKFTSKYIPKKHQKVMSSSFYPSMEDLPDEIILEILSRLPVKRIVCCKCVCKKWRNLVLESAYISKLPECLLIYHHTCLISGKHPGTLKLVEIEDNQLDDHNRLLRDPFMSLDMTDLVPEGSRIFPVGSVNGLICLWEASDVVDKTNIFNPVTKEYMILPQHNFDAESFWGVKYGFGVSMAGEYKVIRIHDERKSIEMEIYTLGTDKWRTVYQHPSDLSGLKLRGLDHGVFFNGHVHWIVDGHLFSFDLDNETFQLFSLPPPHGEIDWNRQNILGVLKGCLGLYSQSYVGFTIWVMKEHQNKKSWQKEQDIKGSSIPGQDFEKWHTVSLNDGLNERTILMVYLRHNDEEDDEENGSLITYCLETNTIEDIKMSNDFFDIITYRPSFLKLQNFQSAGVHLF